MNIIGLDVKIPTDLIITSYQTTIHIEISNCTAADTLTKSSTQKKNNW